MSDNLRIGDSERDEAIALLQQHHAAGRLSNEEFDERMGKALQAKTAADLAALFVDLPGGKPGSAQQTAQPPVTYGAASLPTPVADANAVGDQKPWYAQWWIVLIAIVLTGVTDGNTSMLVILSALWVWVIYPQMAKRKQAPLPGPPPRPLTYAEREQVLYYVRLGSIDEAVARYGVLTGADLNTARAAVAAMQRELGR